MGQRWRNGIKMLESCDKKRPPFNKGRSPPEDESQENILPSEPPEGPSPVKALMLAPWDALWTSGLQNRKSIKVCCLKTVLVVMR